MSLSSSFLFLQASQTLGAGNARDSPRQARGERNSRWRWEPFGKRRVSIPPGTGWPLRLLPPAPSAPSPGASPALPGALPGCRPAGGGLLVRSHLNLRGFFVLVCFLTGERVGGTRDTRHEALQPRAPGTIPAEGGCPLGSRRLQPGVPDRPFGDGRRPGAAGRRLQLPRSP